MKPYSIDVQSHFLPKEWIEILSRRHTYPYLTELSKDRWMLHGSSFDALPYHARKAAVDIHVKVKEMNEAGIDLTILSLSPPGPDVAADSREREQLAKIANDGIAEVVSRYPGRFRGVANLGFGDIEESCKELTRCLDDLRFVGLQMYPFARDGTGIENACFRPLFKILSDRGLPLILHPGSPINPDYATFRTGSLMGYWFDDAMAMIKLILSGLFDELPDLKVVCPHSWSLLPFLIDRIDTQTALFSEFFGGTLRKTPGEYLRNVYTDCNNFSSDVLAFAVRKMGGVDRMMFGSDSPFVDSGFVANLVREAIPSAEDRDKVFFENARSLFRL